MTPLQLAPASGAQASHLAFALLWLPRQRRHDAMVFYRFCRMVDDIADEPARTEVQKHRLLQEWMDAIRDGLLPELEDIVRRYDIERTLLRAVVTQHQSRHTEETDTALRALAGEQQPVFSPIVR